MYLPQTRSTPTPDARAVAQRRIHADYAGYDDAGRLALSFQIPDAPAGFLVRRVVIEGPAGSVARIYAGDPGNPLNLADGTSAGASDVADYAQPLYVPATLPLVIVWENPDGTTPANASALGRVEIEVLT